jgi:hypothetical protein
LFDELTNDCDIPDAVRGTRLIWHSFSPHAAGPREQRWDQKTEIHHSSQISIVFHQAESRIEYLVAPLTSLGIVDGKKTGARNDLIINIHVRPEVGTSASASRDMSS